MVGAPAEPEVRAALDEPALRPYALLWLAEHDGVDPEDAHEVLTREEATWLWVDTAAAVADHGEAPLLLRHLETAVQPTVPALLAEIRAVGHPARSRSWSPWQQPTRTRPSRRRSEGRRSRCTRAASRGACCAGAHAVPHHGYGAAPRGAVAPTLPHSRLRSSGRVR